MIHVFIGTKAQYIKTAPVLKELDRRGLPYRLIDSGQHADLTRSLRQELGLREPDVSLHTGSDIRTIPAAMAWAVRLALQLLSRKTVAGEVFGGMGGICVIHGDTPSTLIAALLAKRAGIRVAHLEAGLASGRWHHPFPEELIRRMVHRMSSVLFAPNEDAARHLETLGIKGAVVRLPANTGAESLSWVLPDTEPGAGLPLVTTHRVENLHLERRRRGLVEVIKRIAREQPVRVVLHGPTEQVFEKTGLLAELQSLQDVVLEPLVPHKEFVGWLWEAPFVITDGGSIQEECAAIGVPTLLWRERTERPDGLGSNVIVSHYREEEVASFLRDPSRFRTEPGVTKARPSEVVVNVLLDLLESVS